MDSLQNCLDTQLHRVVTDNEHLQRENELLQAYFDQAEHLAASSSNDAAMKRKKSRKGRDVGDTDAVPTSLTDEEKNDLVNQALEALTAEIAQIKVAGDKDLGDISTLLEEVELRIADTKKATWEFRRDVIIGGEDARSAKTAAEKVVKFLEDHIHAKEVLVEKLTLKNATYKAAVSKLEAQLAHKEEMGEVLHLVDFDQLKIENQQYMERIAAKNQELLQLKLSAGHAVQLLNDVKARLSKLMAEGAGLRTQLGTRKAELGAISGQCNNAARQSMAATATLAALQATQKNVDQPQIIDYVRLKGQATALQGSVGDMRRKVEVAAGAVATARRGSQNSGSAASTKRTAGPSAGTLKGTVR